MNISDKDRQRLTTDIANIMDGECQLQYDGEYIQNTDDVAEMIVEHLIKERYFRNNDS